MNDAGAGYNGGLPGGSVHGQAKARGEISAGDSAEGDAHPHSISVHSGFAVEERP